MLAEPVLLWNKCKDVQKLGEVCIGVYGDPTAVPSSLGVRLKLMDQVFLLPVLNAKACIDDAVLLQLLLNNPRFKDFAAEIQVCGHFKIQADCHDTYHSILIIHRNVIYSSQTTKGEAEPPCGIR